MNKKDKAIYTKIFSESYYENESKTHEFHDPNNPIVFLDI